MKLLTKSLIVIHHEMIDFCGVFVLVDQNVIVDLEPKKVDLV